jgi:hypothetical protein
MTPVAKAAQRFCSQPGGVDIPNQLGHQRTFQQALS